MHNRQDNLKVALHDIRLEGITTGTKTTTITTTTTTTTTNCSNTDECVKYAFSKLHIILI
jgi:hypothetical protein